MENYKQTAEIYIYLRHGLIIGLFLRVSPIDNNITAPYLDSTSFQSAFGKTSRFMGFIFQEAKSTEKSKQKCKQTAEKKIMYKK